MSLWGFSLWGGSTKNKASVPEKNATEIIEQNLAHQANLEDKADQADHNAKKCLNEVVDLLKKGDKKGAQAKKRRAAMYRSQATTYRQQANNLLQQGIILEEASSNAAVHETMQESLRSGQSLVQHIDPEDVADTTDDWQDLYADAREVSRAMSSPLSFDVDMEDDDLIDNEIAQMMEASSLAEEHERDKQLKMPSIPASVISNSAGGGNGAGGANGPNGNVKIKPVQI